MTYTFTDLDSSERGGLFLLVDKIDQDNDLPLNKCRVYGLGWRSKSFNDKEESYYCVEAPNCDYTYYPYGRYMKKTMRELLLEENQLPIKQT